MRAFARADAHIRYGIFTATSTTRNRSHIHRFLGGTIVANATMAFTFVAVFQCKQDEELSLHCMDRMGHGFECCDCACVRATHDSSFIRIRARLLFGFTRHNCSYFRSKHGCRTALAVETVCIRLQATAQSDGSEPTPPQRR